MGRYGRLARMRQMDPQRDFEQIYRWITQYEFPRDYLHGTSVAFLRDYGVPRISRLLDRTQEFERAGQKRYDDTVLIAYEMVRDGTDSEHGRAAARHLNRIHGRYRIANEDFLYVLATTVVGPKRWIDRFGWRPLCAQETESLALVGRRMGEMMGISHVPSTYAEFERLHDDYEREMFAYDPANRRVAAATLRIMAAWYPAPLRRIAVRASLAVLDEPLLTARGSGRSRRGYGVWCTGRCGCAQSSSGCCRPARNGSPAGRSPARIRSVGHWTTWGRIGRSRGRWSPCGTRHR